MKPENISFQKVLEALSNLETPFSPRFLFRLSDLEEPDLSQLSQAWPAIPAWRRQALLEDAEEMAESDDLLSFEALALLAVLDPEAAVRLPAVRILWDFNHREIIPVFRQILEKDADQEVRAAAATGLGNFVLAGALDELPHSLSDPIETLLMNIVQGDEPDDVRRKALESLGYSERREVTQLIESAYARPNKEWKASALVAMGHSADTRWSSKVIAGLSSSLPLLRAEAARAAGELELSDSTDKMIELLDDPDEDVRQACIWSLAQIGGLGVREALEKLLDESEDDDEQQYLEDALELLSFTEDSGIFPLIEVDDEEE